MAGGFETRLYVEDALGAGAAVTLGPDRAHFLRNVLRLRPGAPVALFNGRDGEWLAKIGGLAKKSADLTVIEQIRPQETEADIWLAFAPIKRARIDFIAQKATELGATLLWPIFTQFTAMERVNTDRLRANAVEAAEQCGRLSVPEVREPARFERFIEAWPADRRLFCCDETGGGVPAIQAFSPAPARTAGLMIGPEGGLANAELDRLDNLPNVCRVSLGPRILRADTAALAALACWQAAAGDWVLGSLNEIQ